MSGSADAKMGPDYQSAGGLDMKMSADGTFQGSIGKNAAEGEPQKKGTFKRSFLKWSALVLACLLVAFILYRWGGTSHYQGTVQRVYEKETEYRVEFADQSGKVRVFGNKDIRFPYFKIDTADLHAELNRLASTGDLVEVEVWGFRQSWFSAFPNLIEVKFLQSRKERERLRAERVADSVIAVLANRDALKKNDGATRDAIVEAVIEANKKRNSELIEGAEK